MAFVRDERGRHWALAKLRHYGSSKTQDIATFEGDDGEAILFPQGSIERALQRTPVNMIPAATGTYIARCWLEGDELQQATDVAAAFHLDPVVAGAACMDGYTYPVVGEGVVVDDFAVVHPDGG